MRAAIRETFAGVDVGIRELTLDEIRGWLAEVEAKMDAPPAVEAGSIRHTFSLMFDDIDIDDLLLLTDLTLDKLPGIAPSAIEAIYERAKAVNRRFFVMRGQLMALGMALVDQSLAKSG